MSAYEIARTVVLVAPNGLAGVLAFALVNVVVAVARAWKQVAA